MGTRHLCEGLASSRPRVTNCFWHYSRESAFPFILSDLFVNTCIHDRNHEEIFRALTPSQALIHPIAGCPLTLTPVRRHARSPTHGPLISRVALACTLTCSPTLLTLPPARSPAQLLAYLHDRLPASVGLLTRLLATSFSPSSHLPVRPLASSPTLPPAFLPHSPTRSHARTLAHLRPRPLPARRAPRAHVPALVTRAYINNKSSLQ